MLMVVVVVVVVIVMMQQSNRAAGRGYGYWKVKGLSFFPIQPSDTTSSKPRSS